jgi:uncharacterized protein (TIGR02996 family)
VTSDDLYDAIVRNPDDDDLRLRYADAAAAWDVELGEFIRLQVARARDEAARGVSLGNPSPREAELRAKHGSRWGRFIAPYARAYRSDAPFQGYEFERGFVAMLRTEPDMIADMGDELLRMAPIQHLDLTSNGPFIPALTAPCLGKLRSLVCNHIGLRDDDAVALADRGHLDRCEYLNLAGNDIDRRGAIALLDKPLIRGIPVVTLRGNPGDPAAVLIDDVDGSLFANGLYGDGKDAEARYGHIPWLHLSPTSTPDRYHARTARSKP